MSTRTCVLILIVLTLAIYLGSAFTPALLDDADAGHAEAAKEIIERGDWVTLYINGVRYLEKGPLLFWSAAVFYKIVGVGELGTRLPLVLGVLGITLVCFGFGKSLAADYADGNKAGLYAGLIFATGWGTFLFSRIFIPDILITFLISLAIYCYWRRWPWGFWIALAGAVLAKGLIGMIFPLGAVGLFILWTRRWDDIRALRPVPGTILFLLIAAPWHVLAAIRTPDFLWKYFVVEHFQRFLGQRYPPDYDKVPLLLFWGFNLLWAFPWTGALILLRRKKEHLLLWIWAGLVMVFFSFSTRQEYYTMPAWPAMAVLLGDALARAEQEESKWLVWVQGFPAALGIVAGVALGAMLWVSRNVVVNGDIASLLSSNPDMYKLSLGHMFDLQATTFAALRFPAAGAAVVLSLGYGAAWWLRRGRRHLAATLATALTAGAFFYFAHDALKVFEPYLSSQPLAQVIERVYQPGDRVVIDGEYYFGSSVGYYLKPKVYLLNGRMTGLEWGSRYPDCPPVFISDLDVRQWWGGQGRVLLFTDSDKRKRLDALLGASPIYQIGASGGKFVLSNRR